jgi:hypothetical protein
MKVDMDNSRDIFNHPSMRLPIVLDTTNYCIFHNKIALIKISIQIKYEILNTASWCVLLLSPTETELDVWLR